MQAESLKQFVIASAAISGFATIIQLIFITIFYSGVWIFGPLNDIAFTTQLVFTLPVVIFLSSRVRHNKGVSARFALPLGLLGLLAAISLQLLLIFGVLSFFEMIGPLMGSMVIIVLWFALIERAGRHDLIIPRGRALAILAGLSFGYPIWAFKLIRKVENAETMDGMEDSAHAEVIP
ncbi:MAG: hypothetical protein ACLFWD_06575 [Anaerolineales bacterium]